MSDAWERSVPVYDVPIRTRPFYVLCALAAVGCGLALFREVVGLGPASGMNDLYAWGIWKTLNIMVFTGLGSGALSIGAAIWIFGRNRLHVVMRTAVLSSFFAYASGLTLLGLDVGRPWNFYWILAPWRWNVHSPMLEVAFCMPLYTALPLFLEGILPVLQWVHGRWPELQSPVRIVGGLIHRAYPWILGFAFLLPMMHQSSLGALMLLAGNMVHPLWQTPWLPLLYVWAACFLGFVFVSVILVIGHLAWNRPLDAGILSELNRIAAGLIAAWLIFRLADLAWRGRLPLAVVATMPALLFWAETLLLTGAVALLAVSCRKDNIRMAFQGNLLAMLGGMFYRFDPAVFMFHPRAGAFYFPSTVELLIDFGFVALFVACFNVLVKVLPVLPASTRMWRALQIAQWNGMAAEMREGAATRYVAAD